MFYAYFIIFRLGKLRFYFVDISQFFLVHKILFLLTPLTPDLWIITQRKR